VIYIYVLDLGVKPPVQKLIEICSLVFEMEHAARLAVLPYVHFGHTYAVR